MTVRGTLALAAAFVLLAGYLVLTEPPDARGPDPARRLAPSLDHATTVEIDHAGQTIHVERTAGGWSVAAVADLMATLATMEVLTAIDPEPGDSDPFGFGDALRLRVLAGTEVLFALEVGAANPARTGVYVRRLGQPSVLLVGALLRWELEKIRRVASTTGTP